MEWVDPFWAVLTLNEERAATRADFARLFNFMDVDGTMPGLSIYDLVTVCRDFS